MKPEVVAHRKGEKHLNPKGQEQRVPELGEVHENNNQREDRDQDLVGEIEEVQRRHGKGRNCGTLSHFGMIKLALNKIHLKLL